MVKNLKLSVINDNKKSTGLKNDWGWSVIAESEKWSFIFDADTRGGIIQYNSEKMGINLGSLDFAVLSHYHLDHYGGFEYVSKVTNNLKIYVPSKVLPFIKDLGFKGIAIKEGKEIEKDVWSSGPIGTIGEQAIGIKVNSLGIIVIVGCSHPGVDVLTKRIKEITGEKIYLVIGGFHLPSKSTIDNLAKIAEYIAPAHCTGIREENYIMKNYENKYIPVKTGSIFEFGKH